MLTNHPFVSTPNNGPCSSCGRGRGDAIHKYEFDAANRSMNERLKKGVTDAFKITLALAETIRELGQIPAGSLYAVVMQRIDHRDFESAIGVLVSGGLVRRDSAQMLHWIGPNPEEPTTDETGAISKEYRR